MAQSARLQNNYGINRRCVNRHVKNMQHTPSFSLQNHLLMNFDLLVFTMLIEVYGKFVHARIPRVPQQFYSVEVWILTRGPWQHLDSAVLGITVLLHDPVWAKL